MSLKFLAGRDPVTNRVGVRFGRINSEIWTDRQQQLVTADDKVVIAAPERRVFGRVTVAHADIPCAPAKLDRVTFGNAGVAKRQGGDAIGKIEGAFRLAAGKFIRVHSRARIKGDGRISVSRLFVQRQHPRHQPSGAGCDQRCPHVHEPPGKANVVRVMVGDDDATNWLAAKRRLKNIFPNRLGLARGKACVDDGPAVTFIEGIDIHMVQRHRQRKSDPKDAVCDGDAFT